MTLRVGVVGTGIMGADHVRTLTRSVSGAAVTAVADLDAARAHAVASVASARVFEDPFALVKDPSVDAVLVASGDSTHEDLVLASLGVGKPVLCEKPLAPTSDACLRIVAAEVALGRRLVSVGFMRRFDPGYLELKSLLADGEVGTPLMVHNVHRNASAPEGIPVTALLRGSAVHEFDILRWLLSDEIVSVSVRHGAAADSRGPILVLVETAGGVLADVEVFVNCAYGYDVGCELVGSVGTLTLAPPVPSVLRSDQRLSSGIAVDWRDRFADAYRRELQAWVSGPSGGGPSAWDGYVATAVAEAGTAALASGTTVPVTLADRPALYA